MEAVSVFNTGDKDNSARNANIDDLTVFASAGNEQKEKKLVEGGTRTVCRLAHLTELVRKLDLNDLPHGIAKGKCKYRCPHQKPWVQRSLFDPHECREEDEYGAYMLRNWITEGDQFPVRVGLEISWVSKKRNQKRKKKKRR